ncbi:MAG: patatin-like phospholipase family protein [Eubacterium sp.]|nr:patatin-like phospholipase family protein [Eubacterium sp.]
MGKREKIKKAVKKVVGPVIDNTYKIMEPAVKPIVKAGIGIKNEIKDNNKFSPNRRYFVKDTACIVNILQDDMMDFLKNNTYEDICLVCQTNSDMKPHDITKQHYKVHKYAGEGLKKECEAYGWQSVSSVVYTGSYGLKEYGVNWIIHVVSPRYADKKSRDYYSDAIIKSCHNILNLAKDKSIKRIIIPHIYSNDKYTIGKHEEFEAKCLLSGIRDWARANKDYYIEIFICSGHYDRKKKYDRCSYMLNARDVSGEMAIVLSGGGGAGAFEVGVWEELEKLGITSKITGFSGTSIGAINSLVFTSPVSMDEKKEYWFTFEKLGMGKDILQSYLKEKIYELLDKWKDLDFKELLENKYMYSTVCKAGGGNRYLYWNNYCKSKWRDSVNKLVRESAAHPLLYAPKRDNKRLLYDGGTVGIERKLDGYMGRDNPNTPIQPLYDLGYRKIIVIYLKPEEKLRRQVEAENDRYKRAQIIRIFPEEKLGNLTDLSKETVRISMEKGRNVVKKMDEKGIFL